jgi:hypothetical protein
MSTRSSTRTFRSTFASTSGLDRADTQSAGATSVIGQGGLGS